MILLIVTCGFNRTLPKEVRWSKVPLQVRFDARDLNLNTGQSRSRKTSFLNIGDVDKDDGMGLKVIRYW